MKKRDDTSQRVILLMYLIMNTFQSPVFVVECVSSRQMVNKSILDSAVFASSGFVPVMELQIRPESENSRYSILTVLRRALITIMGKTADSTEDIH